MKVKLRFDSQAVKEFCLDHVEKFLFGGVILVFLAFVLGAVERETLDFGPEKLANEAQDAKRHLDEPRTVDVPPTDFTEQAGKVREPIPDRHYTLGLFDPPVFTKKQKRQSPNVTLVSDLLAVPGHGAFNMQGDEEDETGMATAGRATRGQRWVSVLGVIPNAEQIHLFQEAFENSDYNTAGDSTPEYIYAYVECAEIDPHQGDTAAAVLKWKSINVNKALAVMEKWSGQGQELADPAYLPSSPTVCFPPGPLSDRSCRPDELLIPDKIPLAGDLGEDEIKGDQVKNKKAPDAAKDETPEDETTKPIRPHRKRPKQTVTPTEDLPDEPIFDATTPNQVPGGGMQLRPGHGTKPDDAAQQRLPGWNGKWTSDVDGQWIHAHGQWVHAHGQWVHAHGQWVHAHGQWINAHGPRINAHHGPRVHAHGRRVHAHGPRVHAHGPRVHAHGPRVHAHGRRSCRGGSRAARVRALPFLRFHRAAGQALSLSGADRDP